MTVHMTTPKIVSIVRYAAKINAVPSWGPAVVIIRLTNPAQNQKYWPSFPVIR